MSITKNTISASLEGRKTGRLVLMDGEWYFLPDPSGGVWTAHILRKIADLLDENNTKANETTYPTGGICKV